MRILYIAAASTTLWKYLICGIPMAAFLIGLCSSIGKIIEIYGGWHRFSAEYVGTEKLNNRCIISIRFQDKHQMIQTANVEVPQSDVSQYAAGDRLTVFISTDALANGDFSVNTPKTEDEICLKNAWKRNTRHAVFGVLLRGLLGCAAMMLLFYAAMHYCFPAR